MAASTRRSILQGAAAGLLVSPVVLRGARGDGPRFSLKMGFADVASSPFRKVLETMTDEVREKTGGAVEIKIYSAGELGTQNNILTGMQVGIVDMAAHTTGFIQTLFPKFGVLDLPYVFPDQAAAERALDGKLGEQLFADMPAKGIYGLSWIHWGWRPVSTVDKPAPKPADLGGVKIRVQPGAVYAAIYKQLGAVPVAIDVSEVYLALSQHAIDAIETPIISVVAGKNYEVVKFVNLSNIVYNAGVVMMSKRKLDGMPSEYQTAIKQAAQALSPVWREATVTLTEQATATIKEHGVQVLPVNLAAYKEATRPVYEQFRPIFGTDLVDEALKQSGHS